MMALRFAPTIPVRAADGSFSGPLLASQTFDNPLAIVNLLQNNDHRLLLGNLFADIDLADRLTFRSSVSYTSSGLRQQRYTSRLLRAALGAGQANVNDSSRTTVLTENTLTLRRNYGRNDFTLLGGVTAQEFKGSGIGAQGDDDVVAD
jgi:hypothetical protein